MKTIKVPTKEAVRELEVTRELFDKYGISGWDTVNGYNSILSFFKKHSYITQLQRMRLHDMQRNAKNGR